MYYPTLSVSANTRGRDFVIGDLHGWLAPLQAELDAIGFNPEVDRLFSVGDLIDRGPYSEDCLKLVEEPWFFAVRGNHEEILFNWLADPDSINTEDWMRYGGKAWMENGPEHYFQRHPEFRRFAERLAGEMPWAIELALPDGRTVGITHSSVPVDNWFDLQLRLPQEKALRDALLWNRPVKDPGFRHCVEGVDLTVHGHVILPHIQRRGNGIYIDTGAALFGHSSYVLATCPHPRLSAVEVSDLFRIPEDYRVV